MSKTQENPVQDSQIMEFEHAWLMFNVALPLSCQDLAGHSLVAGPAGTMAFISLHQLHYVQRRT